MDDLELERAHFRGVLRAWSDYLQHAISVNSRRRASLASLPHAHQQILAETVQISSPVSGASGFRAKLDEIDDRIRRNADVLEQVAQFTRSFVGLLGEDDDDEQEQAADSPNKSPAEGDQDRVRTVLRQIARDWSSEGYEERRSAYQPLIDAVDARVSEGGSVLVPGAGLGRLAFEFALKGYRAQGNEFSYYMLLPSHFILNNTSRVREHTIYPYIHSASNWVSTEDMLRPVHFPDVLPTMLSPNADFSMVAGEFVEVYAKDCEHNEWDAVATCFFIDTAKNLLRYLEVINRVLRVGGVWANVGPLLWHFEHDSDSIELSLEEVMELLPRFGFEIEERRTLERQQYTGSGGMLAHLYMPEFWVCRKTREIEMAPAV
ncbi:carnosine N-methyltransferase [Malassezia cuniculi]|uniref:carnosine N-methyltransferase n=1 Tax=Malassezia cuniculi TaxID=948313 RepID=A0AAF0J5P0_9BASI|nr:carnosine N-methyltransferase [Malassezia cuniculi]